MRLIWPYMHLSAWKTATLKIQFMVQGVVSRILTPSRGVSSVMSSLATILPVPPKSFQFLLVPNSASVDVSSSDSFLRATFNSPSTNCRSSLGVKLSTQYDKPLCFGCNTATTTVTHVQAAASSVPISTCSTTTVEYFICFATASN